MLEKVQADRQEKLRKIRELGIDPYGGRYNTAEAIADVLARYQDQVAIAHRVTQCVIGVVGPHVERIQRQ